MFYNCDIATLETCRRVNVMEKDFEDFIARRCADALSKDKEYQRLKKEGCSHEEEFEMGLRIGYKKGYADRAYIKECSQKV